VRAGRHRGDLHRPAIIKAVIAYGPSSIPRLEETSIDARVLLFTLAIAALTAGLFALAPAWRITRQDIREALQQSGNAVSSGKASQRYREALVVAQGRALAHAADRRWPAGQELRTIAAR